MQCYAELLPATAVTDAIALNFLDATHKALVVAKTSLLQVFKIHHGSKKDDSPRLILIGEYELSGTIISLKSIHTQDDQDGIESLLVAFRHAKMSLVRWDHENHRISTVSIHYYEGDTIPRQPCDSGASFARSILTVDPSSRCVALKFDQRQLAILPFRQGTEDLNELDEELDDTTRATAKPQTNGTSTETPYKESFVLSLPSLDETLTDVIDLAFLHDYREPTFGILTSNGQASCALWADGKDILTYHILTLDLEQGASTILVSIPQLPVGLWKVHPLPAPIGGALLIGTNEVVHVAQSGKTSAVTVNEFAEMTAGVTAVNQASLDLRLEDCTVDVIDAQANDVLFALRDGTLAVLHFSMLGPDVKSLRFTLIAADDGGRLLQGLPSAVAHLDSDTVFIGSDESDSILLKCKKTTTSRKRSHADMLSSNVDDEGEEAEDDEDDDLYGASTKRSRSTRGNARAPGKTVTSYSFAQTDSLMSLGPLSRPCYGHSPNSTSHKLEMAAISGRGRGSRLATITRDLTPNVRWSAAVGDAKAVWSVRAAKPKRKGQHIPPGPDNFLFVFDGGRTTVYEAPWQSDSDDTTTKELVQVNDSEFEHDGDTVDIGTLGGGRWIVHCRQSEVRTYEPDLSLSQIIPMTDEQTDAELNIVYTQFCDPYLLVIRSDSTVAILAFDKKSQDIEPLSLPDDLAKQKCTGGSIYCGPLTHNNHAAFILLDDGTLQVLSLPALKIVFATSNLPHLPPIFSGDPTQRRVGYKETPAEIIVADIGHIDTAQPFLILRTSLDDIVVYEPFNQLTAKGVAWSTNLRFRKVPVPYIPKYDEYMDESPTQRIAPLRRLRVGKYAALAIPGKAPCLMLSESSSRPKVLRLQDPDAMAVCSIQESQAAESFAVLSKTGYIQECTIPDDVSVATGLSVRKFDIGDEDEELKHVAYHEKTGMYIISTSRQADFLFHEEDTRHPDQDDITSRPTVPQCSLHLYSASTHRIINTFTLPPGEMITTIEVMPLEVSEHTHELRPLVAVGTAFLRGQDMPARGALVLFDLLPVIPEPGDDETGVKLHVMSRENVKGAVTTVAPFIGGLVGISQGQKIMVRGMKEDKTCLPVAFLDCLCQLNSLKTLWQTGLWLAADSWKGIWFGGFTEDPYKLTFLGKSDTRMEIITAEFLPFEGHLFILAVDAEMDMHVLQYDPEDPKIVSGARLLHRASFHTGHWPTSMTLVPSTLAPLDRQGQANGHADEEKQPLHHVLITTQSGAVHIITPLDSSAYRRLTNLHGQMISILEHPAALNPREYRAVGDDLAMSRGVVDGTLIQRIGELSSARRAEVLGRCGSNAWELRSDLEILSGGGLGWL